MATAASATKDGRDEQATTTISIDPTKPKKTVSTRKPAARKKAGATKPRVSAGRGKLVIVESPAKARTIGRYLGSGFTVKA